jgi:DNA-binding NtrC family response regulator
MRFSAARVGAILTCLDAPAILIGQEHEILAVNPQYAASFGNGESLLGRRCYEVSHRYGSPCDLAGEDCPLRHCRDSGEPYQVIHVHHPPEGEEHEEITTHPVRTRDGRISAFLEVIRPSAVASARPCSGRMVGRSRAFNRMLGLIRKVAARMTPVLLLGETGTGKELAARAIHQLSERSRRPFVPVDCSGLSETLFESELFGHERGSFTGAQGRKTGLVEAAAGGTLFLDEVGDIPLPQQIKLLRLLESGLFRRVGSTELIKSDFRLVCATHRELPRLVEQGVFRKDLYYRLSVFPIELPPLRERTGDIPLLAESLLCQVGCGGSKRIDPRTLEVLEGYDFPGNVRELRNVMERACLLAEGDVILPEHLPRECRRSQPPVPAPAAPSGDILPLERVEQHYLSWAVDRFSGNHRELADRLGLSERTLYRKLRGLREAPLSGPRPADR